MQTSEQCISQSSEG